HSPDLSEQIRLNDRFPSVLQVDQTVEPLAAGCVDSQEVSSGFKRTLVEATWRNLDFDGDPPLDRVRRQHDWLPLWVRHERDDRLTAESRWSLDPERKRSSRP